MKAQNFAAFIIPSSDPHSSEYVAPHWQFRTWISGFTGSAGVVFITQDYAGLSTDSRYFIQAKEELASNEVVLHQQKIPHQPQIIPWLKNHLPAGTTVGIDPRLFSISQAKSFEKSLSETGINLKYSTDIIDKTWENRPSIPKEPIFELSVKYTGQPRNEKIRTIQNEMRSKRVQYHLINTLDDIAWIFNIRGYDVECNPIAIAYAIIELEQTMLFIDKQKIPDTLQKAFAEENINIYPYTSIDEYLSSLKASDVILLDPSSTNAFLYHSIQKAQIKKGLTISTGLKARKNKTEISNIRNAMLKDGVALTKLYRWIDATLEQRSIPETEVAEQLIEFRKAQGEYYGESFSAIVGYKGNGAIVHYRAKPETCAAIQRKGILLLDSGGQYHCGTTDITRTTAFSPLTPEQKRNYTLVLKGHIAVASLRFPYGTRGNQVDLLARKALWEHGLNYGHGTGHGVGFFLNVHEGPQSISSANGGKAAEVFEPGMFTSNEPGFYKPGEYGIRIENLVLCVETEQTEYGRFLCFETMTLFPIDTTMIDFPLLTKEEVDWLNDYHQKVEEQLHPLLNEEEKAWLTEKCKPV
jgi:Xaa-Pro aminopeptidase